MPQDRFSQPGEGVLMVLFEVVFETVEFFSNLLERNTSNHGNLAFHGKRIAPVREGSFPRKSYKIT